MARRLRREVALETHVSEIFDSLGFPDNKHIRERSRGFIHYLTIELDVWYSINDVLDYLKKKTTGLFRNSSYTYMQSSPILKNVENIK